jgi:hypothetical protein
MSNLENQSTHQKDQIILAPVWGILADLWVPHGIESCNFQNLLVFGFPETSQNLISYRQLLFSLFQRGDLLKKSKKTQKSAKIDPNRDQDDLFLIINSKLLSSLGATLHLDQNFYEATLTC